MNLNPIKFLATLWFRYQDYPRIEGLYDSTFKALMESHKHGDELSRMLMEAHEQLQKLRAEKEGLRQIVAGIQNNQIRGEAPFGVNL